MPIQPVHAQPAPRLAAALHYVIARSAGLGFGEVKINKAVVEADAEFYRRYGKTITGAEFFQKQQFGPVPNGVLKALAVLKRSAKIAKSPVQTPTGIREEYVSLEEPDTAEFSGPEIDVMALVIAGLQRISASTASERTHDALWDETPMFGQIPIRASAFRPRDVISEDVLAWALSDDGAW